VSPRVIFYLVIQVDDPFDIEGGEKVGLQDDMKGIDPYL